MNDLVTDIEKDLALAIRLMRDRRWEKAAYALQETLTTVRNIAALQRRVDQERAEAAAS